MRYFPFLLLFFLLACRSEQPTDSENSVVEIYSTDHRFAPLIQNVYTRQSESLNGEWHFLIDPYETGYRNHRNWKPFDEAKNTKASASPYWKNRKRDAQEQRIEYDFDMAPTIEVPGDWNHQLPELEYYEGTIWYERDFEHQMNEGQRTFLYFGAANYRADVYLNGQKVGFHEGGYTPFNFEVSDMLTSGSNELVVRVDNRREANRVPGLTSDWWNYGGLIRDVKLVRVPKTFIQDYHIQLDKESPDRIKGYVRLNGAVEDTRLRIEIPEIDIDETLDVDQDGLALVDMPTNALQRWYPERPKLYNINLSSGSDRIADKIGFRTIETKGTDVLLNGQSIFMRGICLHDEDPSLPGRIHDKQTAQRLLAATNDLNVNMLRLAHYPHNEHTVRLADSLGFLLWKEIPVYWGINYTDSSAYEQAEGMLRDMIGRDKNRASVIIWSVANETPRDDPDRLAFLERMAEVARSLDGNRIISAALDRTEDKETHEIQITDPFAQTSDMVSANEYIGWYGSTPDQIEQVSWDLSAHDKPFFISEFGAGALQGLNGPKEERWTEEHQAWMYEETLDMLDQIPSLRGITPWILNDFRSPRRNLSIIQDGWNRKGIIGSNGRRKQAYDILSAYYREKAEQYPVSIED
ncbi:MAG: glycoside hydrolase family 2 TIM barrel-domain containing protein [Bacteroidota bacterium]